MEANACLVGATSEAARWLKHYALERSPLFCVLIELMGASGGTGVSLYVPFRGLTLSEGLMVSEQGVEVSLRPSADWLSELGLPENASAVWELQSFAVLHYASRSMPKLQIRVMDESGRRVIRQIRKGREISIDDTPMCFDTDVLLRAVTLSREVLSAVSGTYLKGHGEKFSSRDDLGLPPDVAMAS